MPARNDFSDQGWERIKREVQATKGRAVKVGVLGPEEHESGEGDVLDIATYNEFGTERIPARPFIRGAYNEHASELGQLKQRLLRQIEQGRMTADRALSILGELHTDQVQAYLTSLRTPPNAPSTVARKGSSNPLIDTGHLRRSITYEVE